MRKRLGESPKIPGNVYSSNHTRKHIPTMSSAGSLISQGLQAATIHSFRSAKSIITRVGGVCSVDTFLWWSSVIRGEADEKGCG